MWAAHKVIYQAGPWQHSKVIASANAFHVVSAGNEDDPLILLLHGFGQYWYTWRDYLIELPKLGYRVAAIDLRGYGDSDQPPRGYDPRSVSHDIAAVIRTLGASSAIVIGHDWGGFAAWVSAKNHPELISAIGTIAAPHPNLLVETFLRDRKSRKFFWLLTRMQIKTIALQRLTTNDAALLETWLNDWNNNQWPDPALALRYRTVFLNRITARSAIEYYRWAARSLLRIEGRKFYRQMRKPIKQDVLVLAALDDPLISAKLIKASKKYTKASFSYAEFEVGGHHPHERYPEQVIPAITNWLAKL
jgi:pimeloyl-ACP methyl ester carboxylesterase